jgi:glycosyltransferase involved in cell wall biosynthesis
MRIAVIGSRGIPGVSGGVERHCEELYPRLVARGAEVTVYARDRYVAESQTWRGVDVVTLPSASGKSTEAISHTYRALMVARKTHPDIVHIHSIGPASLTGLASALGMRTVVTAHAADYQQSKWGALASRYLRFGEAVGVRNADEVIAVSRHYAEQLERGYARSITVIPNGPSGIEPTAPGPTLAALGVHPGTYALYVGRLTPDKRVEDLLEACANVPGIPIVVVGGPVAGDAYVDALHEAAVGHPVVFAGERFGPQLAEIFTSAGAFVLPSGAEGLSLSLLEAMAYGIPCVASDIPGNRELLEVGELGALVPVGDREALRAEIEAALAMNTAERTARASDLKAAVASAYDWETIADRTMDVYRRVVSR